MRIFCAVYIKNNFANDCGLVVQTSRSSRFRNEWMIEWVTVGQLPVIIQSKESHNLSSIDWFIFIHSGSRAYPGRNEWMDTSPTANGEQLIGVNLDDITEQKPYRCYVPRSCAGHTLRQSEKIRERCQNLEERCQNPIQEAIGPDKKKNRRNKTSRANKELMRARGLEE